MKTRQQQNLGRGAGRRRILFTVLAGLVLAMPACETKKETRGTRPGQGYELTEGAIRPVWKFETGGKLEQKPYLADGTLYVVSGDEQVFALNQETGKVVWSYRPQEANVWGGSLLVAGGTAYFGTRGGYFMALDAATGAVRWKTELGINAVKKPALHQGRLFVPTTFIWPMKIKGDSKGKAKLFMLNAATGTLEGEFTSGNFILVTPVVADDLVFVGGNFLGPKKKEESGNQRIYALEWKNGLKVRWSHESYDGVPKTLYVGQGVLNYVGYLDYVVGLNAATGKELWRTHTGNWTPGFNVFDGRIFFGAGNNQVLSLEQKTGKRVWHHTVPDPQLFSMIQGAPVVQGERVYWSNQIAQVFTAAKADSGEVLWNTRVDVAKGTMPEPAFAGKRFYIAAKDGVVAAYEILK